MNKNQSYLRNCPCNVCIVGMICRDECPKEINWYLNLSEEDRLTYISSEAYRFLEIITKESFPNFVK